METSVELPKKRKRSFVEAWLSDDRYNHWIRRVSSDDTLYYCTVCEKNFSCNAAHVSRHADSVCHRNKVQERQTYSRSGFLQEWLDIDEFKLWLCKDPHDNNFYLCKVCEKSYEAHLSHIRRHAKSATHLQLCAEKGIEASKDNDFNTQDAESPLSFDERKKSAEIRYAALIAEKNIPFRTAKEILSFFQHVGEDPNVLKSMSMGLTKCSNIISNVLYPVENIHVVHNLQRTKFSIFIDETSDICNEKWMTFFVRYVDPETLDIRLQLTKLINIDARDCSAEKLFQELKCEMSNMLIPFHNNIALSCDNASVMTGKHSSFKTKLEAEHKDVITLPCPCHSAALAAHAACAKLPSFCDDFLKKIANFLNTSPKRTAYFQEFCECFQEKYRKILKLSETRWLSHHTCVVRLLESWNTMEHFLREMVVSDKQTTSAEYLLSVMENVETKAYFLFLQYFLNFFNAFNAFFQAAETRIHLLQMKSENFLSEICRNFVKEELMKDLATLRNFSQKEIQKNDNEIFLGSECEQYLKDLMAKGYADIVATIRQKCLQVYETAANEIYKRLPINDTFLKALKVFGYPFLFDENREPSLQNIIVVARKLGAFNEDIKREWLALPVDFTQEEKDTLSKLNFDEMWKQILQRQSSNTTYKYPILRDVLNAVRALPNSNADPERVFSILTDLKTKRRNKLSSNSVNAICVLKSGLKARGETAITMKVTEQHLSRMSSDILYAASEKKKTSCLNIHIAEDEGQEEYIDDAVAHLSLTQ